jgi:DNA primase
VSRYRGRQINDVALWENYVEFPANQRIEADEWYLPKVECPNPAHDTLKRHFQVNAHDGLVHCFALCGISGSYEHAICVIEGLYEKFNVEEGATPRERKRRADRARREASKRILKFAGNSAARKKSLGRVRAKGDTRPTEIVQPSLDFETFLPPVALEYLQGRLITDLSISRWGLGWLPNEKRIAIPAYDENGTLRFLIQRAVTEKQNPKYLYSEGFPKTHLLWGAGQMDIGMVHSVGLGLVEGSIDTIRQHQHGNRFFGAILGTGISDRQCRIIARFRPKRIYLWFDKDSAGIMNIEIAAAKLKKYPLYIVRYPKGKSDPAETTKKESLRQIGRAVPISRFITSNGLSVKTRKRSRVAY